MNYGKPEDILDWLKPGQNVYLQGGPGECLAFIDLLRANPGCAKDVMVWSCLIPGINTFDYASQPDGPNLITFMASPALEPSIASGRTELRAMPYSAIGELLHRTSFDLAILHTAPPDNARLCSFGIAAEAPGIAWPRAGKRIAFLNQRMPAIARGESIPLDAIDLAIPIDTPLLSPSPSSQRSAALATIARHGAALIPDGATIQSGIGEAPGAILSALKDRRGMRAYSGIVTPQYRDLAESGALDPAAEHVAGIAWGSADFYDWLKRSGLFAFRPISETHDRAKIAAIANFVSIGSALEVDLTGALNLEWANARRVSSVGGAPDYIAGAAGSKGGLPIIAMLAATRAGNSRIVRKLVNSSVPGGQVGAVVTEHGAADLRGLSPQERVAALIAIADPASRELLRRS